MEKRSVKNTSAQIRAETGTRLVALLLAAMLITAPIQVQAYWRWNYDWKTVVQVGANTAAASAVEETHNATLNEQRKKQENSLQTNSEVLCILHLKTNLFRR